MRHYKIVKKSTHFLIAISAFAIVFNIALLGAVSVGFVKISQPEKAKAACDPNTAPASATITPNNTDRTVTFSFNKIDIDNIIEYKAEIKNIDITDLETTDAIPPITGTAQRGMTDYFIPSPITTLALQPSDYGYRAIVSYRNLSDTSCVYSSQTVQRAKFNFEATTPVSLHGEIILEADPSTINLKMADGTNNPNPTTTIKYKINGHSGEVFHFWKTNCTGTYDDEFPTGTNIPGDIYPLDGTYNTSSWTITEKTCSAHRIRIKTFKTDGTLTGSEEIAITVTGADSNAPPDGTIDDPITTPTTISGFGKFTSAFKMPNHIKGIGDLVTVIIKLLEYLLGVFAFFGIVVSGIQYISSGGDPAKAEKAKKNLMYCVIGIVVAVLALTIQGIIATFWSGPT